MASNKIKGLTVEIGGDTTKLGKALEDVNKKSRNLSSELGEINRLLRLDPGNTDLLAQKQRVLADAVENTGEKLKTLREAERQVQQQFERGEVSEEQYRALQREIIATERQMDNYQRAVQETEEALRGMGRETQDVEQSSGKLGAALGNATKVGLSAIATASAAAVTGLVAAAESTREYRAEMGKLDTAFTTAGHSSEAAVETYQALQGVLGETDQAVEAANHLAKLTTTEEELADWTDICTGVYATFGASLPIEGLTEAANETAKVGQVTGPLADALNWAGVSEDKFNDSLAACTTEQERQTLITETLNGLYSEAAAKYRETNAEVIRANEANEAWTASLAGVGGAIEPVLTDVKLLGASLLSEFLPGVESVAQSLRGVLSGDAGAAGDLGAALSGMLSQALDMLVQMAPELASTALSLITSLVESLAGMLPQVARTLIQLSADLISQLATTLPPLVTMLLTETLPGLITNILAYAPQLLDAALQLFSGLVQALPTIATELLLYLPEILDTIFVAIIEAVPLLLDAATQLFMGLVQALPPVLDQLITMLPQLITQVVEFLVGALPGLVNSLVVGLVSLLPVLLDGALQLFMALVQAVPLIVEQLAPLIPQLVLTVVQLLIENLPVLLDGAFQLFMGIVQAVPLILDALDRALGQVFGMIGSWLSKGLQAIGQWGANIGAKALQAGSQFLQGIVSFFSQLPGRIYQFISTALSRVVEWGTNLVNKGRQAAKDLVAAVVNGVKGLPDKLRSVGSDLVRGLWNGINDMVGWVKGKIQGFSSSVLDGIKSFFGVHSPSREMAWIGEMLDQGLAQGIEQHAKAPLQAITDMASEMLGETDQLGGVTMERRVQHSFAPAATQQAQAQAGLLSKLDSILAALERGQVIAIDGKQLIGATAIDYDKTLGQRRALAVRGAL